MSNHQIRSALEKQFPQLKQKSTLIPYYINFQFPEKQVKLLQWWQNLLKSYLIHSKKILLTCQELEKFFYIHGIKPIPICNIFHYFLERNIVGSQQPIQKQQEQKTWFKSFTGYIFGQKNQRLKYIPPQTKLFITQILNLYIKKCQKLVPQIFNDNNVFSFELFKSQIIQKINLEEDIDFLIDKLNFQNIIKIDKVDNQKIIIFNIDKNMYKSNIWVQFQKTKYNLNSKLHLFQKKIDQKINQLDSIIHKAKSILENGGGKEKAKIILRQRKPIQQTLNNLTLRRDMLSQAIVQLQSNEMNATTVDAVKNSQQLLKKYMVDPSTMDDIVQQNRNIQQNQKQIEYRFMELKQSDQQDVDEMMNMLQQEVNKEKKNNKEGLQKHQKKQINQIQRQVQGIKRLELPENNSQKIDDRKIIINN